MQVAFVRWLGRHQRAVLVLLIAVLLVVVVWTVLAVYRGDGGDTVIPPF